MILNEVLIETSEELEAAIAGLDDATKASLRATFAGESTYVEPTQSEKDKLKYMKRARALDTIIAEMAVENIARVRAGTWTVAQLIGLTQDETIKEIISDLTSLSFEIAYQKVNSIALEYVTTDIKNAFKAKLYANFFNS